MMRKSPLINVMEKAARKAARGLLRDFGEVENLQVSRKGPADFVSEADRRADRILREELMKARPSFGIMIEESGETEGSTDERWIVDPLDGTTNFLHGIPHFAISIGLEKGGEPVAGMILDPIRDELFWAERGVGAYVNQRRLRVSSRQKLADAVLATGIPFAEREGQQAFTEMLKPVMAETAGVRRFGSAALDLAYVAAGRYDGFWEVGLQPWDVAAGIIIVREAGGFVTGINGRGDPLHGGHLIAANGPLHGRVAKMLTGAVRDAGLEFDS